MSVVERNAGREMLDAEPLKRAIRRDAELALLDARPESLNANKGYYVLSERIGIPGDILTRILTQRHVGIDMADRYCCATNRLLRDLYPEVYEERVETIVWRCKKCRVEVDMDLLYESKRRMYVRCRDCGRGHYVERFKRGAPPNPFPSLPVTTETIVAEYLAGASGAALARKYGFCDEDGVYSRLRRAGVPRRSRVTPQGMTAGAENLAAYRERRSRESAARAVQIAEMWDAFVPGKVIAEHFGVSITTVKTWRRELGLRPRLPGGRGWA